MSLDARPSRGDTARRSWTRGLLSVGIAAGLGAAAVPFAARISAAVGLGRPEPVDRVVSSALGPEDARLPEDGSLYEDHEVVVGAGWRIEAEMSSAAFDAWLQLFGPGGAPLLQNDDAGPGTTDARLELVAPRAGVYTLRANARARGMSGAYRLRVRAAP